jgi:hypothetical protein
MTDVPEGPKTREQADLDFGYALNAVAQAEKTIAERIRALYEEAGA